MSHNKGQHFLPAAYLRKFSIDTNDKKLRNLVYCMKIEKYPTFIKEISVDANYFKIDNFYTASKSSNPLEVEFFLGEEIEPLYNIIISELSKEINPTVQTRAYLMTWIYFNKYRNIGFRENLEIHLNDLIKTTCTNLNVQNLIETYSSFNLKNSKAIQLSTLVDFNKLIDFTNSLGVSHWTILKSSSKLQFITNDNPGFSWKINKKFKYKFALNPYYSFDDNCFNFYVISPEYCLLTGAFSNNSAHIDNNNQRIEFKLLPDNEIDRINKHTAKLANRFVISNQKQTLEKYSEFLVSKK